MIQAIVSFLIYLVIQVAIFFIGFNVMKKEDTLRYSYIHYSNSSSANDSA